MTDGHVNTVLALDIEHCRVQQNKNKCTITVTSQQGKKTEKLQTNNALASHEDILLAALR